jgi:hypothetical protein
MGFEKLINKVKSKGIEAFSGNEFIINKFINSKIKDYGKVIEFCLKPEKREIHLKVLLVGEKEPIDVDITGYDLVDDEVNPCIIINKCTTSKEWMTVLAEKFLCGKELPIPKDKFAILKSILV